MRIGRKQHANGQKTFIVWIPEEGEDTPEQGNEHYANSEEEAASDEVEYRYHGGDPFEQMTVRVQEQENGELIGVIYEVLVRTDYSVDFITSSKVLE